MWSQVEKWKQRDKRNILICFISFLFIIGANLWMSPVCRLWSSRIILSQNFHLLFCNHWTNFHLLFCNRWTISGVFFVLTIEKNTFLFLEWWTSDFNFLLLIYFCCHGKYALISLLTFYSFECLFTSLL